MHDETTQIGREMTESQRETLLADAGHGVLSLAAHNSGYGIPISFGYDETDGRIVFEFLALGESKKEEFVRATEEATLTVYRYRNPDDWESVIVTGTVHPLDAETLPDRTVATFASGSADGAEAVRWQGAGKLERNWYELEPASITGRREG